MPSPAERRLPWERAARGLALVLLALALVQALRAAGRGGQHRVHVEVGAADATAPGPARRDSLAALARAGDSVTWSGDLAPLIASAEPVREPSGATRFTIVADAAAALGDSLGTIDSLETGGGSLTTEGVRGLFAAHSGAATARVPSAAAAVLGRVLVYGRVGWESKFTIAALEESGWQVDARLRLGDTTLVRQGRTLEPTVGLHAALVVLDTALEGRAEAVTRFVRAGGGLVLSGAAAGAPALAALGGARVLRLAAGEAGAFEEGEPLHALPLHVLGALRPDALTLESRDDVPAVVARRVAAGRVVQSGYAETWRWRMQGEAGSVAEHRAFWSRLVGTAATAAPVLPATATDGPAVAPAVTPAGTRAIAPASTPTITSASALDADPAPLAALVDALGPAVAAAPSTPPQRDALPTWLGAAALLLLVAEWGSRRARGAA